jgi:hypothetical protein
MEIGCHPFHMAAARIGAVLLVVLAANLAAQNASTDRIIVSVVDPIGAIVPSAHIGIIWLPSAAQNDGDWLHYAHHASEQASANTDASGKATVDLAKGNYVIAISAKGFMSYLERIEIRNETSQILQATLRIGDSCPPSPCPVEVRDTTIPLERDYSLNIFIRFEPLQTMTPPAMRVRRRLLRF